jgi:hypothetical protein
VLLHAAPFHFDHEWRVAVACYTDAFFTPQPPPALTTRQMHSPGFTWVTLYGMRRRSHEAKKGRIWLRAKQLAVVALISLTRLKLKFYEIANIRQFISPCMLWSKARAEKNVHTTSHAFHAITSGPPARC